MNLYLGDDRKVGGMEPRRHVRLRGRRLPRRKPRLAADGVSLYISGTLYIRDGSMLKKLIGLFANRDWQAHGNVATGEWQMRRWTDAGWEVRPATSSEVSAANHWQAAR